ncbi:hypothetical protein [Agrobacterium rosae]|uniref:hypothetical protein n=1 Tax=Agrobacterium rosae TaxID=1972867 RepID=UPI0020340A57|nr:hypothetical protein [Agrobacterium rosae]MCM2434111.1 hypothetical protein [Agrobacterium rosae]
MIFYPIMIFIEKYFAYTLSTCVVISIIFLWILSNRIYTAKGRIIVDLAWVVSGTGTLLFVVLGMIMEEPMAASQILFRESKNYVEEVSTESDYLYKSFCTNILVPTSYRDSLCKSLKYLNHNSNEIGAEISRSIGLAPRTPWRDVSIFSEALALPTTVPQTENDKLVSNEFARLLGRRYIDFNQVITSLSDGTWIIELGILVGRLRLIFLHFSLVAGILRIGRSCHELLQDQQRIVSDHVVR